MAFDQTPTRNKLILIVTGITFVSLIALKFVFDSYYSIMIEEETISKIDQSTQGDQLKAIQAIEASKSAAIAGAMANLAKGDRADFAAIAPKQSDDVQALEGWIKIKRAVAYTFSRCSFRGDSTDRIGPPLLDPPCLLVRLRPQDLRRRMPVHLTLHQELTTKMRKTFAQSTTLLSSLWRRCVVLCVSLSVLLSFSSLARDNMAKELEHIGVEEHLDGPLPLDALFKNHEGNMVRLGDFFGTKPVLLVLGYHTCPTVCTMIQNAAATSIKDIAWTVGKEFSVVVLSI